MTNLLLTNDSLKKLIEICNIDEGPKQTFISALPELDAQERMDLFESLKEIYLLKLEKVDALEKIKKFWQK